MVEEGMKNEATGTGEDKRAGKFLTYGISNLPALFVGGGLLGIKTLFTDFIGSRFVLPEFHVAWMTFSPILYIPELIVMVFILGYLTQCVRELAKGNHRMVPPRLNNMPSLIKDGVVGGIVLAEYYLLIDLAIFLAISIPQVLESSFCVIALLAIVAMIAVVYPLVVVAFTSWVAYSRTGDVLYAMNAFNGISLIRSNPGNMIQAIISMVIIGIPVVIVSYLSPHVPYLSIAIPWLAFYQLSSFAFIFNDFYENAAKGKIPEGEVPPARGV